MARARWHLAWGLAALACTRGGDDEARERAARLAVALYQPASAEPLDVRQVAPRHGLWQVTLQRGTSQDFVDVFITDDGEAFAESLHGVDETLRAVAADRRFAECLKEAGVSVLVSTTDGPSQQQLRQLGRFASSVAIACDQDMANCARLGVREFPTVQHKGTLHPGAHTVPWFETLSGCKR